MDKNELRLYADLEEIFIFENMNKLDEWPPKQHLLSQEFCLIIEAFYDCQKIVQGKTKEFVILKSVDVRT
jgi:hypothetical protein